VDIYILTWPTTGMTYDSFEYMYMQRVRKITYSNICVLHIHSNPIHIFEKIYVYTQCVRYTCIRVKMTYSNIRMRHSNPIHMFEKIYTYTQCVRRITYSNIHIRHIH